MKGDCTAERPDPFHGVAELVQHPEPEPQACASPLWYARPAARQRELDASKALAAQGPQKPSRTGVRREGDADVGMITLRRKGPIECCAHVVALRQVRGVPVKVGALEPFVQCMLE